MVRREDGDTEGPFYRVLSEGMDNDGDGEVNEDAPITGFISNRNYPAYWASTDARFRGEGDYPLQEHNARVLVDFILSKPQISQIESWHTTSGIHLRPYAARPDTDFPPQDLQDYSAILAKGTAITTYPGGLGLQRLHNHPSRRALRPAAGSPARRVHRLVLRPPGTLLRHHRTLDHGALRERDGVG